MGDGTSILFDKNVSDDELWLIINELIEKKNLEFRNYDLRDPEPYSSEELKEYFEKSKQLYIEEEKSISFFIPIPVKCWSIIRIYKNFVELHGIAGLCKDRVEGFYGDAKIFMDLFKATKYFYLANSPEKTTSFEQTLEQCHDANFSNHRSPNPYPIVDINKVTYDDIFPNHKKEMEEREVERKINQIFSTFDDKIVWGYHQSDKENIHKDLDNKETRNLYLNVLRSINMKFATFNPKLICPFCDAIDFLWFNKEILNDFKEFDKFDVKSICDDRDHFMGFIFARAFYIFLYVYSKLKKENEFQVNSCEIHKNYFAQIENYRQKTIDYINLMLEKERKRANSCIISQKFLHKKR